MKKLLTLSQFLFFTQFLIAQINDAPPPPPPPPKPAKVVSFNPGKLPEFPGGDAAMQAFAKAHLVLTKEQQSMYNGTKVQINFSVDSTGVINGVSAVNNNSQSQDPVKYELAYDLIRSMPAWSPGRSIYAGEDYPVGVKMVMTIQFPLKTDSLDLPASIVLKRMYSSHLGTREQESQQVFSFAEEMPKAEYDFNAYLMHTVKYPQMEKEEGKTGTVYVGFIVEADGTISNVSIKKSVAGAPGLDFEAARVMSEMPKWTPGKMNGRPVRVEIIQPVRFVLQ